MQITDDDAWQDYFLQGVSRTFALTIPVLPMPLRRVVSNAYLQCRIIDTIEDDPGLDLGNKKKYSQLYVDCLEGNGDISQFADELYRLLSPELLDLERELVKSADRVLSIYSTFSEPDQEAILECVQTMSAGMIVFQQKQSVTGLRDLQEMEDYCYFVAGVVGEMLTRLYASQNSRIKEVEQQLMPLARSFGQGLQMTNILKDVWDDLERGVCWLPEQEFQQQGYALKDLSERKTDNAFKQAMEQLIALAHFRLQEALNYTLRIPKQQKPIRQFNLWSLGMAMLTLRKLYKHLNYRSGDEVKISRNSVRVTILLMSWFAGNDRVLKILFYLVGRGLPDPVPSKAPRIPAINE